MKGFKIIALFVFATIFSIYFTSHVAASSSFIIDSANTQYQVSPFLEILEDEDRDLTIEDVSSGLYDDDFFKYDGNIPNFGYTSSAYWTKITIRNATELNNWLLQISYPPLDMIRLYVPGKDGEYIVKETGDLLPFSSREIMHRDFVFRLDLPVNTQRTIYLEIITGGSAQIPVTLSSGAVFQSNSIFEYLLLGLYYGMGIIMVIYNLFLFFSLRLASYLWYTLLVTSILAVHFTLNGLAYQYIWPEASWWNNIAILFFMSLSSTITLFFSKSFLNTKVYSPKINKLINWFILLQVILFIILFISYEIALNLIMGIMFLHILFIAFISIMSWINGIKAAKFFFFGWIAFLIGIALSSLADMGIVPVNVFTKYASQMGSGIEIALFSLALGAKIKWLRLDKVALEKQAMQSQRLAVKHLQQANKLKDDFLANTSHELRTPLQGIIGIAESLKDRHHLNKETKHNLALIVASGEKLKTLINDLLDITKLKYDELTLEVEAVELWKVTEVVCQVSAASFEKPISLKNYISKDFPLLAADETRIQQILYNLISNALKYTYKGDIIISAEVIADNKAKITVSDTGIGISGHDLQHIFDEYRRGENVDDLAIEGTGLGLNITKQLVTLHHGEITIDSKVNHGTTVCFTVPLFKDADLPGMQINNYSPESQSNLPVQKIDLKQLAADNKNPIGNILLVDDESINVHVLYNHLNTANYEVSVAYDGKQALNYIDSETDFDLVILDIMLPEVSGFDVAMKIRENYTLTELPILMLTSKSQTTDILTAFHAGANDYLMKPCAKEELLARVQTLLSLRMMMKELTEVNEALQQANQTLEEQVEKRTIDLTNKTLELEQMNTSRKQLMTNISHELGTPMTSVKGYMKAILDGLIKPDDTHYITLVYQKILFIERLIQDLYELSRLESRQISFNWKSMDIHHFLQACIREQEMDVRANGLQFVFKDQLKQSEKNAFIAIDIDRIKQVMNNLIFNAIRFTKEGGTITIHAKITEKNTGFLKNFLQITVQDTGIGMDQDMLENIFERFYQKNDQIRPAGNENTGLGLSIAKEIITYHNGFMWAESASEIGSSFHYLLPLNEETKEV